MQSLDAFVPADSPGGLAAWEDALLRQLVLAFVRSHAWLRPECEDLLQDARLHYLQQRARSEARDDASPQAFLRTVVRNRLLDRLKAHFAERRGRGVWPQRIALADGEDEAGAELEPEDKRQDPAGDALTAVARAHALARLSAEQQRIALAFEAGAMAGEVAAAFGLKAATLYDERQRIRRAFTAAGFPPPPRRRRPGLRCSEGHA